VATYVIRGQSQKNNWHFPVTKPIQKLKNFCFGLLSHINGVTSVFELWRWSKYADDAEYQTVAMHNNFNTRGHLNNRKVHTVTVTVSYDGYLCQLLVVPGTAIKKPPKLKPVQFNSIANLYSAIRQNWIRGATDCGSSGDLHYLDHCKIFLIYWLIDRLAQ